MNIVDALAKLDKSDDAHWTDNGLPRMDVLQKMTNDPDLTRKQVIDAAPDFTRSSEPKEEDSVETPSDSLEATESPKEAEAAKEITPDSDDVMVEAIKPGAEPVQASPEQPVPAAQTKLESLQAALGVHTEAMNAADRIKEDADRALKAASDNVNRLSSEIANIVKNDPRAATAGIRNYIAQSNRTRMKRAMAAQEFMGDSKVKFADVAKAVEVFSPLDKAMRGRKPARGAKRPETRVPAGA